MGGLIPVVRPFCLEAKCFETRLRCFLVEPAARENAAGRFDAQRGRACSLVGNYIDLKARMSAGTKPATLASGRNMIGLHMGAILSDLWRLCMKSRA